MKFTLRFGDELRTVRVLRDGPRLQVRFEDGPAYDVSVHHRPDGTIEIWPLDPATSSASVPADMQSDNGVADETKPRNVGDSGAPCHRVRTAVTAVGRAGERQLWVEGRTLRYALHTGGGAGAAGAAGALSATIPAVVLEVLVAEGDAVTEGQKLVLLESMKMVIPIQAPHAGRVVALRCAAGDAVEPGVPLLELSGLDDAEAREPALDEGA